MKLNKLIAAILYASAMIISSCDKVDEHADCMSKDQVSHYVDSLMNEHENAPKPPVEVQDIVVINKEISIKNNHSTEIYFRVNPSNAEVDLKCFHLDSPDTYTKAVSYITAPKNVKISSVTIAQGNNFNKLRGQYIMTIEDMGLSTDYTERVAIVYASKDAEGHYYEVSSEIITITLVPPTDHLAKVYIDTPDGAAITSKTEWMEGSTIKIIDENGKDIMYWYPSKYVYSTKADIMDGRIDEPWYYDAETYSLIRQ